MDCFDINLTMLVQIINFLIAFFVLKNFFFKQAIAVLEIKEKELVLVNNEIATQDVQIAANESILHDIRSKAKIKFFQYFNAFTVSSPQLTKNYQITLNEEFLGKDASKSKLVDLIVKKAKNGI